MQLARAREKTSTFQQQFVFDSDFYVKAGQTRKRELRPQLFEVRAVSAGQPGQQLRAFFGCVMVEVTL